MAPAAPGERGLDQTPTWAVAAVCAAIVVVSLVLEKVLHWLGHWFTAKKKAAMVEALEKVKAELMILGFISLMLTFTQNYIVKICIPQKVAETMLPCSLKAEEGYGKDGQPKHRRLLWEELLVDFSSNRRFLAAPAEVSCANGKVPLFSVTGLHQLHLFIFFLAVFHVVSSALTMALGRIKIRWWKEWERETQTVDYEFSSDPSRFHYVQDNTFVRQHLSCWNRNPILFYTTSFFRQFFRSVRKEDYLIMRHGFISVHLAPGSKFDFQKYIKRSLEDDFKVVVGISPILWASAGVLLLLNVKGWYTLFWISFLPLVILLAVGTKLQAIITEMAVDIHEKHVMVQGVPLVSLGDHHFWFKRPSLILFLIHFTLFQNAFQLVYFLWIWHSFGLNSCFHEKLEHLVARICLGVFVQFLCSYVTLPLYALVSQLGSNMKRSIFDEHTSQALKKWHQVAKKNREKSTTHTPSRTPVGSPRASPGHHLHRYKTIAHSAPTSASHHGRYYSDNEMSDNEVETPPRTTSTPHQQHRDVEMGDNPPQQHQEGGREDFSFAKPAKAPQVQKLL